jgi:hypothetical protein
MRIRVLPGWNMLDEIEDMVAISKVDVDIC